jgi:hypothetical protein
VTEPLELGDHPAGVRLVVAFGERSVTRFPGHLI